MPFAMHAQILIVEDHPAVARVVKAHLEALCLQVEVAYSAQEALKAAEEFRPDLVILDVRLPDGDGYEVCRRLRDLFSPWTVPILMLTGLDRPVDRLRGYAHGADAYLTKPFDSDELICTTAELLGRNALP